MAKKKKAKMGRPKKNIPWHEAKLEYIMDHLPTYKSVAEKFGCSEGTVFKTATKERWAELKKAFQEKYTQAALDQFMKMEKSKVQKAIQVSQELQTEFIDLIKQLKAMYQIRMAPWFKRAKKAQEAGKEFEEAVPLSAAESRVISDMTKILQSWANVAQGKPTDIHGQVVVATDLLMMVDEADDFVIGDDGEEDGQD